MFQPRTLINVSRQKWLSCGYILVGHIIALIESALCGYIPFSVSVLSLSSVGPILPPSSWIFQVPVLLSQSCNISCGDEMPCLSRLLVINMSVSWPCCCDWSYKKQTSKSTLAGCYLETSKLVSIHCTSDCMLWHYVSFMHHLRTPIWLC